MRIFRSLFSLFHRRQLEADMAEEMQRHVDLQTDLNLKAGMKPDEARYAALRQFGNVASLQEQAREQRGWLWLEQLLRDILFAGRMLRRNSGFTAAVVISLALCIGVNLGIYSMLHALVIRPLPFHDAGRIVAIYNSLSKVGIPELPSNFAQYSDFKLNAPAFENVALWDLEEYTVGDKNGPVRISGAIATAEIFPLLGVRPLLGRFFMTENQLPGSDMVVVLAESFWNTRFQHDPGIIGQSIELDGMKYEIIGVAPRIFEAFDARAKLIRPLARALDQRMVRTSYSHYLYGRLTPVASTTEASAQVVALEKIFYEQASVEERSLYDRSGHQIHVNTVQDQLAGSVKTSLYLLQGGALFVLFIGCVNVANLLLARANARRAEFAMRASLGAGHVALARQLLTESAVLSFSGAGLGLALAWSALGVANQFTARLLPNALPFTLDAQTVGVVIAIAAAVALFIGLLPVGRLLSVNLIGSVQSNGRGSSSSRRIRAISSGLVIAQVAFVLVLLTGAGLLMRSFAHVLAIESGFDAHQTIGARIGLPENKEKSFPPRLLAALQEIPGLEVSMGSAMPFRHVGSVGVSMPLGLVHFKDYVLPTGASQPSVFYSGVLPSYLSTMRIPLREGRWFNESDMTHNRSIVVDEAFAARYFADRSAIGQRVMLNLPPPQNDMDWQQIIGVVGNVRANGLEDKSGQPFVYVPLTQMPFYGTMSVFIRTARPLPEMASLLREKVAAVDSTLPVVQVATMGDMISDSLSNRRGILWLLGSFAVVALLLSAVGIYGMLAYDVSQRTKEIGIRAAIGATRVQISAQIMHQGMRKTLVGIALGLVGAGALSGSMTSLLFAVKPNDPLVYVSVSLLLISVAGLASWLPARRAAKVDPVVALRAE